MELFKLLGTIAIENSEANEAIDETTDKAGKSEGKMTEAFKNIGKAVVAAFTVEKIVAFGKACVESAASVKALDSQFEQTFGEMSGKAEAAIQSVADSSNILDTRLKGIGTSIYAFAKTTGMDSAKSLDLMQRALIVTADSAAYYDRSLEETSESLKSFLKGNYENDAALGLSCTETTRNTAANKLYGKSFNDLSEAQKQLTLLKMVEDANKLSGALGQAAREGSGWENVIGNLKEAWAQFMAVIGEPVLEALIPIIEGITKGLDKVSDWMKEHKKTVKVIEGAVLALAVAFVTLKSTMLISSVIEGVSKAMIGLNAAMAANPIGLVVVAITALVAALVALGVAIYKNWDDIKAWCADIGGKVKNAFVSMKNNVKEAASSIKSSIDQNFPALGAVIDTTMEAAKKTISEKLSNIQSAFDKNGGGVKGTAAAAIAAVKGYYTTGLTFIDNMTGNKLSLVASKFQQKFTSIRTNLQNSMNNIKSNFDVSMQSLHNSATNILNNIGNKFSTTFSNAKTTVQKAIEKIKGFFDFEWKLPEIKLPHFKITPKGWKFSDILQGDLPKLSVEWYAKGGIMNQPTAFGFNGATNSLMVGGEAGAEAVAPIDTLKKYVSEAVAENNTDIAEVINDAIIRLIDFLQSNMNGGGNMQVVLDSGALVGQIAPQMSTQLGNMVNQKRRGN